MGTILVFALLSAVPLAVGGLIYFLVKQRRDGIATEADSFRRALIRELRSARIDRFSFDEFVKTANVRDRIARSAADAVYMQVANKAASDGEITDKERKFLETLGDCLRVSASKQKAIQATAAQRVYREHLTHAMEDGNISAEERSHLDELRTSLGMTASDVAAASGADGRQQYRSLLKQIARHPRITDQDVRRLHDMRTATGLSEQAAFDLTRRDALDAYRERYTAARQDGRITADEEAALRLLQIGLKIPDQDVVSYLKEIERLKELEAIRNGALRSVRTNKLLDGGEICYWDSSCAYRYQTRANVFEVNGEVTLTSNRIIFTAPNKSFEYRASRIVNIEGAGTYVEVQTSSSRGSGWYGVGDGAMFSAVLEALVRRHKYLAAEEFSSARSRHIPDIVKQKVWDRDGGRCAKCGATDYLEFDHVIPLSRGGANTENNIQILCRRCNALKSDRIG